MRRSTILLALALTYLSVPGAWAEEAATAAPPAAPGSARSTGIEVDFRMGYGVPAGRVEDGSRGALDDRFSGVLPLIFGLGYRVHPRISVGGYLQYGISTLR